MLKIDPHIILPCLILLAGTFGLGITSTYALTMPGFSCFGDAEQKITAACAETTGCTSLSIRRDSRLEGIPGLQIVFVVNDKLTEHGKSALTSVVEQYIRRQNAVAVVFEAVLTNMPAQKPLKAGVQSSRGNK